MSNRPRTPEEYVGLVEQVIFELEELRDSCAYDIEAIDANLSHIDVLLQEMRKLRASMADGSYCFGRTDLPFMHFISRMKEQDLPFLRLFYLINQTHREGLETAAE